MHIKQIVAPLTALNWLVINSLLTHQFALLSVQRASLRGHYLNFLLYWWHLSIT